MKEVDYSGDKVVLTSADGRILSADKVVDEYFSVCFFAILRQKQNGLVLTNPVTLIRQKAHGAQITSSNPRSIPCFSQLTVRP